MICKIRNTISEHNMLETGDKVIVALSGGSDSMVLLDVLKKLSDEYSLKLSVAHVNHMLRGDESDRDERFVRDYCEKNGIECFVLRCDVAASRKNGESLEEAGRRVRYDFFKSIDPDAKIATAHNLSDNAETLIFNLTRGSGLKGLCSIPACRDNIVRPLLSVSKKEILDYCNDNDLPFVTDSTNAMDCYTRNKIRHNVIPILSEINPSFLQSVERLIQSLNEDEIYLTEQADRVYDKSKHKDGFCVSVLKSADRPLLKRVIIRILSESCDKKPSAKHIENMILLLDKGGSVQVSDNVMFRIRKGILEKVPESSCTGSWCADFSEGEIEFPYGKLKINKLVYNSIQNVNKDLLADLIDCDKIKGSLKIRSRCAGDKFTSHKNKMTKSLKKLFNEFAVLPEDRDKIPIISDDCGILWIQGFGVSQRVKCDNNTKEAFYIKSEG